jgi:hypothetical protein
MSDKTTNDGRHQALSQQDREAKAAERGLI